MLYWVGRGVLRLEGKDYHAGSKVPEDKLSQEKIKALKKSKELINEPIQVAKTKPKVKNEGPKK
jgi:hypothetical protein